MNWRKGISRVGASLVVLWSLAVVVVVGFYCYNQPNESMDFLGVGALAIVVPAMLVWMLVSLLNWIGSGFRDAEEIDQKENNKFDITAVALYPIMLLADKRKPFDYTLEPNTSTHGQEEFMINATTNYMLYCYYILSAGHLGNDDAEEILRIQRARLDGGLDSDMGTSLYNTVKGWHSRVADYASEPKSITDAEGVAHEMPLEYSLALYEIVSNEDSPFYVAFEDRKNFDSSSLELNDMDWDLATHLAHAKEQAIDIFQPVMLNFKRQWDE